jgi:peptidoglycan/LPS O-acetylase OafA/YrhL
MRGIAALIVLGHHVEREYSIRFGLAFGYMAVDLFFLMSGFVVASAYEPRIDAGMTVSEFLLARLKRLYPMIFLGAVLGLGSGALRHYSASTLLVGGLGALTVLPLIWPSDVLFPLNSPEWSLFYEIAANLLHRLLKPVLGLAGVAVCVVAAFFAMGVAGWKLHGLANGWSTATFWGGTARALFSYFLGVLLFRLTAKGRLRLSSVSILLPMLAFIGVVMFEAVIGWRIMPSAYWLCAVSMAFPIILLFVVSATIPKGFAPIATALGDLSYPLYAVHMPILMFSDPLVLQLHGPARWAAALLVAAFVVVVAVLLHHYYDRPVRRMLTRARRLTAAETDTELAAP